MKNTKRLLALLLAAILGLGLGGISAAAEEEAFAPMFAQEELEDEFVPEETLLTDPAQEDDFVPAPIEAQGIIGGFVSRIFFDFLNNTFFGTVFYRVRNFLSLSDEELMLFFPIYMIITAVVFVVAWPLNIISGLFSNFLRAPAE